MNIPSCLSLGKLFGVLITLNAKFILVLGMVKKNKRFSNIGVSLGCLCYFHTKVCSQMTSGRNLCQVGTSRLIYEAN